YNITVFEKSDQAGGILRYGIPDFKLEKWVLDRRINLMKTSGIKFETEVNIGVDLSYRYMKKSFDVILLTTGAGEPRDLKIPGRELDGIDFAMDYLTESNLRVKGTLTKDEIISAEGKNVLVIGGGDTGSDCVGTANRQGAKKVYQFEIMKKPDAWDKTWNPVWPEWPMILRTSSSHEEGVNREWSILIKKFTGKNNNVEEAHCLKIDWKASKKDGRLQMNEIPESKFVLKIDMVFLAMGFLHTEYSNLLSEMGLEIDEKGNLKTFADYTTSVDGVFAAGDSDTGASLVVQAIYHGQESAKKIHEYILKKSDI
ncbi:MAG: FAD-dependent oxidoreductase, partial [Spirochaetes bacterium]|nr:FAD-dependent oxidoreductase [Spirochaetota bacterium]